MAQVVRQCFHLILGAAFAEDHVTIPTSVVLVQNIANEASFEDIDGE